jgi:hypothetical protein
LLRLGCISSRLKRAEENRQQKPSNEEPDRARTTNNHG